MLNTAVVDTVWWCRWMQTRQCLHSIASTKSLAHVTVSLEQLLYIRRRGESSNGLFYSLLKYCTLPLFLAILQLPYRQPCCCRLDGCCFGHAHQCTGCRLDKVVPRYVYFFHHYKWHATLYAYNFKIIALVIAILFEFSLRGMLPALRITTSPNTVLISSCLLYRFPKPSMLLYFTNYLLSPILWEQTRNFLRTSVYSESVLLWFVTSPPSGAETPNLFCFSQSKRLSTNWNQICFVHRTLKTQ